MVMQAGRTEAASCFYLAAIDHLTFPGILSVTFMSDKASVLSDHVRTNRQAAIARILLIALVALVSAHMLQAGQAKPKKHEVRHEIFDLEDAWRDAVLKSDINAMSALLADDYMAITATGMLQTKQESLANMRAHRVHVTTLVLSDRKVRFYGKTALVTSRAEVQGTTPEGDISGDFRYTRVYVRDAQGRWRIVSFEISKIHTPGEHKKQDPGPGGQ
jgi:ketosteroid isomerase-like protein